MSANRGNWYKRRPQADQQAFPISGPIVSDLTITALLNDPLIHGGQLMRSRTSLLCFLWLIMATGSAMAQGQYGSPNPDSYPSYNAGIDARHYAPSGGYSTPYILPNGYSGPTAASSQPAQPSPSNSPYGSARYGSATHGSATYGSSPYGSATYGSATRGNATYGSAPYESTPSGSAPYESTPYESSPSGSAGYGGERAARSVAQPVSNNPRPPTTPQLGGPSVSAGAMSGGASESTLPGQLADEHFSDPSTNYFNYAPADAYSFADMTYWFHPVKWEGSVEVGLNGSAGNSESLSIQSGFNLKLTEGDYTWSSNLKYVKTTTDTIETQHNALFNYGVKRGFGDSPWSLFGKSALEYDEFKAWDIRWSINGGFGYRVWKTDITELTTRFGAGTSREFGGPDDSWAQEAVFGLDYERKISKRQKIRFSSDYYPEWQNFEDYRVVTNFGWEFLLDEENNLSLKLDVTDRYDSTPNGRKPNDINYSLLLLWKT